MLYEETESSKLEKKVSVQSPEQPPGMVWFLNSMNHLSKLGPCNIKRQLIIIYDCALRISKLATLQQNLERGEKESSAASLIFATEYPRATKRAWRRKSLSAA